MIELREQLAERLAGHVKYIELIMVRPASEGTVRAQRPGPRVDELVLHVLFGRRRFNRNGIHVHVVDWSLLLTLARGRGADTLLVM